MSIGDGPPSPSPPADPEEADMREDSEESDVEIESADEFYGKCMVQRRPTASLTMIFSPGRGDLGLSERRRLLSQATLAIRHTRGVQDGLQKMPFCDIPPGCFDSKYVIDADLKSETGVSTRTYDMCSRGCQAFTGMYKAWEAHKKCGICNHPRPQKVRPRGRYSKSEFH